MAGLAMKFGWKSTFGQRSHLALAVMMFPSESSLAFTLIIGMRSPRGSWLCHLARQDGVGAQIFAEINIVIGDVLERSVADFFGVIHNGKT